MEGIGRDGRSSDRGAGQLLALLHLCDSLFPIGGFAHSDGLESATASGVVATADDLRDWLAVCLDETLARAESPAVWLAWTAFGDRAWVTLAAVDDEVTAVRPSSAARRASRAMGLRLAMTWQGLYPDPPLADVIDLARRGRIGPTLPVAFAAACSSSGIGQRASVEAFVYTRLAATISAAMRLMPIGQAAAHGLLADALRRVPAALDAMQSRSARPESFAPAMDLASMTQQYVHSRLFLS